MADVDTDGFDDAMAKIQRLGDNLDDGLNDDIGRMVDQLIFDIQAEISRQGLVDSGELVNSFSKRRWNDKFWHVTTSAEHAEPIDEGAGPHTITPRNEPVLAFQPENPAAYAGNPSYDPDSGYVFTEYVEHPGNRPYNYVGKALQRWETTLALGIEPKVKREIYKAGFKPGR
jgi:hypothetical protein